MDTTPAIAAARPTRPRRRRRSRIVPWIILIGLAVACAAVTYDVLDNRAGAGTGLPAYSVYSDGPDGFAQAAALLRNLGWQPVAVTRPIQQTHHRGLLILAEPTSRLAALGLEPTLSKADVDGLLDWVQQGNTLVYCGLGNLQLESKLGVTIGGDKESGDTVYKGKPGAVGEYMARVHSIGIERQATVSGSKAVPLWRLFDRPAAALVRHGNGRVLILPDPSLWTHRGLLRDDNAVFLYNVAALDAEDGRVYFDEYHHGIRSGGGYWSYLRYHGQQWIVLQLLAAAAMALWAVGRRLGPAVPMPVTRQADGVDYASSVARIYEKADVRPLVAWIFARHFLEALTAHLRLRRNVEPTEILSTWRQRYGDGQVRQLGHLLDAAEAMLPERNTAHGTYRTSMTHGWGAEPLLALAQRFDAFLDEHTRNRR